MTTYSDAPTSTWQLPGWAAGGVLLALLGLVAVGWFVLRPTPVGVLTADTVDGAWPFAVAEVEVHCRGAFATVDVDGTAYAISNELRSAPDLATFDLATGDDVWLERDDGTKLSLHWVRTAAEDLCR